MKLAENVSILAWTKRCGSDIRYFGFNLEDVAELIRMALDKGEFLGSEWCQQKKDGPWAACDAYVVFRSEWNEVAYKKMPVEYYIKFAINRTGKMLFMISCHPYSF